MRRMSPRRARSSASLTWSMPATASTARLSRRASSCNRRASASRRAQRVDRVPEVEQQLGVLPPGDVRAGDGLEARRTERRGDGLGDVVHAGRPPADVEDGRRLGCRRWTTPGSRCHVGAITCTPSTFEPAEEGQFVDDAVLQAHDRRARRGAVGEGGDDTDGVLALHGDEDDVVGSERQLGGVPDDGHRQRRRTLGPLHGEPAGGDGVAMPATGNEDDAMAVLEQATADDTTDGAGPVDDEPHVRRRGAGGGRRQRRTRCSTIRAATGDTCGHAATPRRSAAGRSPASASGCRSLDSVSTARRA